VLNHLNEPGKQALDYMIAGWGALIFLQVIPAVTGVAALALIFLRIGIGLQEWRLNRKKLRGEQ
jgi:hypothetical protein